MTSKRPSKQRKLQFNAPHHKRNKLMRAPLADGLREKYKRRSLSVKIGDTVEILKGDFKGHKGKIEKVDTKKRKILVEGAMNKKTDGTERFYPIAPSNVVIVKPVLKDERRAKILER